MFWFRINNRYCIDFTQIRKFGLPKNQTDCVLVTFKDGKEEFYEVDNPSETFERMIEYAYAMFDPIKAFEPIIDEEGELPFGMV